MVVVLPFFSHFTHSPFFYLSSSLPFLASGKGSSTPQFLVVRRRFWSQLDEDFPIDEPWFIHEDLFCWGCDFDSPTTFHPIVISILNAEGFLFGRSNPSFKKENVAFSAHGCSQPSSQVSSSSFADLSTFFVADLAMMQVVSLWVSEAMSDIGGLPVQVSKLLKLKMTYERLMATFCVCRFCLCLP
ncbi:hypothetical protein V6N12_045294 [Hibiscus sabdariffa]|uniref:Uncharacterized protein n=1 Tax=Hibiscus sabdariffa TaxID=183260 RepID=A0ABR2G2C7_9ROSI